MSRPTTLSVLRLPTAHTLCPRSALELPFACLLCLSAGHARCPSNADCCHRAAEGAAKPAMQYFVELTEGKPDDYMSSMDVLTVYCCVAINE